jgi:hypothetical protein
VRQEQVDQALRVLLVQLADLLALLEGDLRVPRELPDLLDLQDGLDPEEQVRLDQRVRQVLKELQDQQV